MCIIPIQDAHKLLDNIVFAKDLEYMCFETYNLWYQDYYSYNLNTFPNWQSLYNTFIDISLRKDKSSYFNCYIAIEDNHIIGFISLNFNDFSIYDDDKMNESSLWLTDLFIWPKHRNKGVGKMLIKYVARLAEKMDVPLYLACHQDMINYYTKLGWNLLDITPITKPITKSQTQLWFYMLNNFNNQLIN